jgi:hypothetical protein
MRIRRLPRLILALCLTILLTFSPGCRPKEIVIYRDVTWVQPIYFQDESKEWLMANQPWPQSLLEDLNKVATHNQKCEEILGIGRPTTTQPSSQ